MSNSARTAYENKTKYKLILIMSKTNTTDIKKI